MNAPTRFLKLALVSSLAAACSPSSSDGGAAGAAGAGVAGQGGSAGTAGAVGTGGESTGGTGGKATGGSGVGGSAGTGGSNAGSAGAGVGGAGGSAGTSAGGSGGASVASVSPKDGTLLTCTKTQFTSTPADVTWSASAGTIDGTGLYASPGKVGPDVTITATTKSTPSQTATSTQKLVTAVPGAKQVAASGWTDFPDVFPHAVAAKGDRVYSVGVVSDPMGAYSIQVSRSDDAGKSWAAAVTASPATAKAALSCAAIAVDATNPDIVHVVFNASSNSGLAPKYVDPMVDDDRALVLVTSVDGGKTFAQVRVLQSGNSADAIPVAQGICPDVASPQGETVVVSTPGGDNPASMYVWRDTMHGQGLTPKTFDAFNSLSSGETGALAAIAADVGQNGSSNAVTQSPRLFTDGKGKLCITYVAFTPKGSGSPSSAAWVQCSPDQGLTFSPPAIASPTYTYGNGSVSHPSGAIGPKGEIAIRWHGFPTEMLAGVNVAGLAVSPDGVAAYKNVSAPVYQEAGTAFSASVGDVRFDDTGVLWIVYGVYDGGQHDRIVVDKSCDLGATWSGSVVINALSDGTIDNATRPSLVPTTGKTAVYVGAKLGDALNDSELRRYTLQPLLAASIF